MTFFTLIHRSLGFYARAHLGVVLGAAVGSAALVGALVVGDSVRLSLRDLALVRLGKVETAMASGDHLFRSQLGGDKIAAVLQLAGTATSEDASARANQVQVLGVNTAFWNLANQPPDIGNLPPDAIVLNQPLAQQLKAKAGDTIVLRVEKPSLLSRDAPISPQGDFSVALRLKVEAVVNDEEFGRFSLQANQVAPFNAFVSLANLQNIIGQTNRANLLLVPQIPRLEAVNGLKTLHTLDPSAGLNIRDVVYVAPRPETILIRFLNPAFHGELNETHNELLGSVVDANEAMKSDWQLADAGLDLRALANNSGTELRSSRIFIDPPVVEAALSLSPIGEEGKGEGVRGSNQPQSQPGAPNNGSATSVSPSTGGEGRGEGGFNSNLPQPILTYFVNELRCGSNATPYSMVTAMGAPVVPSDMRDDEILINEWLADDLNAKKGDRLSLVYFVI
jgi:hypothetical protein